MGTFKNGKRDGFGMLFFKSGGDYIGEFSNGNYHRLGTDTISEFDYYMGFYQNGKQYGQDVK
jgi:hypothetical protein